MRKGTAKQTSSFALRTNVLTSCSKNSMGSVYKRRLFSKHRLGTQGLRNQKDQRAIMSAEAWKIVVVMGSQNWPPGKITQGGFI